MAAKELKKGLLDDPKQQYYGGVPAQQAFAAVPALNTNPTHQSPPPSQPASKARSLFHNYYAIISP
jgi:hypothetical protein